MGLRVDRFGPFLRVEGAAQLLPSSRTSAYALANQWLATGGLEGLPAVRVGRSIRIPTTAIERLAALPEALAPLTLWLNDAS